MLKPHVEITGHWQQSSSSSALCWSDTDIATCLGGNTSGSRDSRAILIYRADVSITITNHCTADDPTGMGELSPANHIISENHGYG